MINASKAFYSPGFESVGIQVNPAFVGGSPGVGAYDFATRGAYVPTNNSVKTGAKNLTGLGWPGPQNSIYQAWRGALDPAGNGSEVGIQA
jgi:hypothetical protein